MFRFILPILLFPILSFAQTAASKKAIQDSIIKKYLENGAWKYSYLSPKWGEWIDKGLKEDSTIAYLWQQKAMPLFKQRKYELGMESLNRAVCYDTAWLDYRGFMKCIFVKNYQDAIADLQLSKRHIPSGRVMDHSYDFYLALCYLQLNQFDLALEKLKLITDQNLKEKGESWQHPVELFYLGVAYMEGGQTDLALATFDRAMVIYPKFADARYYKGICLGRKGDKENGLRLMDEAWIDFKAGYTINEDNVIYEPYPYQVNWKMLGHR